MNRRLRIVGGNVVEVNEYPWQAMLVMAEEENTVPFCGATLVGAAWVMTAAHCTLL